LNKLKSALVLMAFLCSCAALPGYTQGAKSQAHKEDTAATKPVQLEPDKSDQATHETSNSSGSAPSSADSLKAEQKSGEDVESALNKGAALIVGGDEILRFKATISGFTPEQRVTAIVNRLHKLTEEPDFKIESISTKETGFSTDVVAGSQTIFTITDRDARLAGYSKRDELAQLCAQRLQAGLHKEHEAHSPKVIAKEVVLTTIAGFLLALVLSIVSAFFSAAYERLNRLRGTMIKSFKIQQAELLSSDTLTDMLIGCVRLVRAAITFVILLIFCEKILSFYPTNESISAKLFDQFVSPILSDVASAIASYMPSLLIILAIAAATYYLITFTHFLFVELGRGNIKVSGFDPEWADPTYNIARFLIIAFAMVLIFPYLPGSGSPAFQQVSIFLGVLLSLGSSGAVANVVAGVILTYTGAFKHGDRVQIASTVGDVVERRLLYTRIRTIKEEYITIPNSLVLGSHIINYSASMKQNALVLHTEITIAYDVPWRQVQQLLIESALATESVLKDPPPYVLITILGNFSITYQINARTAMPHRMAPTYADLHRNILDKFNAAGIEIASPHLGELRRAPDKIVAADQSPNSSVK
jgi:small-conductance mechanosensitive channel